MRRAFRLAALLALPVQVGCIVPYCAYPTLDRTPRVKLDAPPGEVRAFRVDIAKPSADLSVFRSLGYESLSELSVTNADEVPAQLKPSASYGFVVIGIALNYLTHTSHSVAVRLYRPGYELVEVKSWDRGQRVLWKPAPELTAQEKALDDLFPLGRLDPGSKGAAHREAMLYAGAEYERLAPLTQDPQQRTRLTDKAVKLRERARE